MSRTKQASTTYGDNLDIQSSSLLSLLPNGQESLSVRISHESWQKPPTLLHGFPASALSFLVFSVLPPAPHLPLSTLPSSPLASSFQIILETQMFVYNIRADDLKRPLTVARSQRPLWINQPFFGLSFLGRQNIYTLGAGPISAPQQIIHSCKQPSLVEKNHD